MAPLRILVVDDDDAIRELVAEYLRTRGVEAEAWAEASGACASIRAHPPDAVVTDLRLPDMDGVHIVAVASQCRPPVPVIVTTGYGTVESAVASLKSGAADFILKPFRLRDLYAALERAMERARADRQAIVDLATLALFQRAELASTPEEAEALVSTLLDTLSRTTGIRATLLEGGDDDGALPLGPGRRLRVEPMLDSARPYILAVHRALVRCAT